MRLWLKSSVTPHESCQAFRRDLNTRSLVFLIYIIHKAIYPEFPLSAARQSGVSTSDERPSADSVSARDAFIPDTVVLSERRTFIFSTQPRRSSHSCPSVCLRVACQAVCWSCKERRHPHPHRHDPSPASPGPPSTRWLSDIWNVRVRQRGEKCVFGWHLSPNPEFSLFRGKIQIYTTLTPFFTVIFMLKWNL